MTTVITAHMRDRAGKGAARQARREGMVPAIIYGGKKESTSVTINGHDLFMAMKAGGFYTKMLELKIDGKAHKVLARDVQVHPVTDIPLHVDFLRFDPTREIHVNVIAVLIDEDKAPGVERGGLAQLTRNEIEVVCRADAIPQEILVSVAGKDIGDSVHISEVDLPEGVRPAIDDRDFTVASILSTRTSKGSGSSTDEEGEELEAGEEAEATEGGEEAAAEGGEGEAEKADA